MFAFDKPAGVPCRNLGGDGRCRVHDCRREMGFSGCVGFSCNGAGQRVVQECFAGQSWRSKPALLGPMMGAFRHARIVHDLIALLLEAQKLSLGPAQRAGAEALLSELTPDGEMSEAWLIAVIDADIEAKVHGFLRGLRSVVEGAG